ncbi:MAG: aminomethyl-transferring glycine dehydrogenase subunit GcvPA [Thermodesulfobacteriota bacterium]|nr:aminomethyl-transferring glycine dehydrogenase subunit GcvPA [Thermodesulfobacteriota bacterium]
MRYLPHTKEEIEEMLAVTGHGQLKELFAHIPENCRCQGEIDIPGPLSEWDLTDHFQSLAANNLASSARAVLLGAGSYSHHIPEIVRNLMSRSEFLTAYTPYQPEMAQGTLQGIFEYQTLTTRLLGMEVANGSMYDGASALAEALLMALRIARKKHTVAISSAIHPHYRKVVYTYLQAASFKIVELPVGRDGRTDCSGLQNIDDLAAVALQSPNFFGVIEDLETAALKIHAADALFITCFSEPFAYGLLRSPGASGADIVCGEGQSFGMSQSFGGPGLGMFACRKKYQRNLPGRVVGETVDLEGKRGYVLTLATREQHIRREKATSNICSNQGICALTAAAYMASLGSTGLRRVAKLNYDKAAYFKNGLIQTGAKLLFSGQTFNEFVLRFADDFKPARKRLLAKGIVAGIELSDFYKEYEGAYLFCVTETVSRTILDEVIEELRS